VGRALDIAALAGVAALAGGCFYTDPINTAPTAEIFRVDETQTLYLGSTLELSGSKSHDADGDYLTYEWSARHCASMNMCLDEFQSRTSADPTFDVVIDSKQLIHVGLVVRDEHGARDDDSEFYVVGNHDPTVRLQVQGIESPRGELTVGRQLDLFAQAQDEDDDVAELLYDWTLYPANGSVPADVEWTKVSDTHYQLRPDVEGLWRVGVAVDDGDGGTDEVEEQILIAADRPPCIEITDPPAAPGARYIVERSEGVRRLAVLSVADELDPYPLPPDDDQTDRGAATFRWQIATPDTGGQLVQLDGHTLADYMLDPSRYAPGDQLELRVEVSDRNPRTLPCAVDAPTCSIDDDGCLQRVTWGVEIR